MPEGGYEGKEVKIQGFNYIFFVPKADLPKCLALLADTESTIFGAYLQIEDIKKKHGDTLAPVTMKRSSIKPFLFALIRALVILLAGAAILLYSYSARINSLLFVFLCIIVAITAFTMLMFSGDFKDRVQSRMREKQDAVIRKAEEALSSEIISMLKKQS